MISIALLIIAFHDNNNKSIKRRTFAYFVTKLQLEFKYPNRLMCEVKENVPNKPQHYIESTNFASHWIQLFVAAACIVVGIDVTNAILTIKLT